MEKCHNWCLKKTVPIQFAPFCSVAFSRCSGNDFAPGRLIFVGQSKWFFTPDSRAWCLKVFDTDKIHSPKSECNGAAVFMWEVVVLKRRRSSLEVWDEPLCRLVTLPRSWIWVPLNSFVLLRTLVALAAGSWSYRCQDTVWLWNRQKSKSFSRCNLTLCGCAFREHNDGKQQEICCVGLLCEVSGFFTNVTSFSLCCIGMLKFEF